MDPGSALLTWVLVAWADAKGEVLGQYRTEKECVQRANIMAMLDKSEKPYKAGCYKLIGGERQSGELRGTSSEHPGVPG